MANKCSIASRIDCFSETPSTIFGEKMKDQVEERLSFYDTGTSAVSCVCIYSSRASARALFSVFHPLPSRGCVCVCILASMLELKHERKPTGVAPKKNIDVMREAIKVAEKGEKKKKKKSKKADSDDEEEEEKPKKKDKKRKKEESEEEEEEEKPKKKDKKEKKSEKKKKKDDSDSD